MNGIDVSNWQGSFDPAATGAEFVIVKATEGVGFVDPFCDSTVQSCINAGICWGFYHFAGNGWPVEEADYFVENCSNYFGNGIPVLDWEGEQDADWVNAFVQRVHDRTDVWPWIYANPWRFYQGGVEENCARWVASYPMVSSPSWGDAWSMDWPNASGNVVAWQFCSDGTVSGISGGVDLDIYAGDRASWQAYARGDREQEQEHGQEAGGSSLLENDEYVVEVRKK